MLSLPQAARDINLAPVLGVNLEDEPWYIVQEFSEQGDLTQFLQNHVAESSASKMSDIPTLRLGAQSMHRHYQLLICTIFSFQLWCFDLHGDTDRIRNEVP